MINNLNTSFKLLYLKKAVTKRHESNDKKKICNIITKDYGLYYLKSFYKNYPKLKGEQETET